jgi:hypothetical protein
MQNMLPGITSEAPKIVPQSRFSSCGYQKQQCYQRVRDAYDTCYRDVDPWDSSECERKRQDGQARCDEVYSMCLSGW